jgi:hypothetical protein
MPTHEHQDAGQEIGRIVSNALPDGAEFVLLICMPEVDEHTIVCVASLSREPALALTAAWVRENAT